MFEKAGKYYADWRDQDGRRVRKSFTSKRAALQFEAEQKELAHPKKQARGLRSPKFSAPGISGRTPFRTSAAPLKPSSPKLVAFPRTSSARPMRSN
jgi:hypothetical protein